MATYKITTPVTGFVIEYVEADSFEEALEKLQEGTDVNTSETEYDIDNYDYDMSEGECVD